MRHELSNNVQNMASATNLHVLGREMKRHTPHEFADRGAE
jgi:hypothetical protein